MIDPFGRHISYLRVSVTDRCDFRCVYCMAEEMNFLPKRELLTLEELDRVCSAFVRLGVRKLRLTGGEPLVRREMASLVRMLAENPRIRDLALTTNGILFSEHAEELRDAGLHRVTLSLDTLRPERFLALTVAPVGLVIVTAVLFGYLFFVLFPQPGWLWSTASGLLVLLLVFGGNVEPSLRDRRAHPNEGIRRSVRFALLIGPANAALVGALLTPLLWLGAPDGLSLRAVMVVSLLAVLFGLLRASRYGGMAAIMHWVTRIVLTVQGNTPLRYQRFLNDAEQRVLLHSTGNGFTFPHRLLQEHLNTSADDLLTRLQLDHIS